MTISPGKKILSEIFIGLLDDEKIITRELSWVASSEKYFFKIPRISESLKSDMNNPEALKFAREEYDNLTFLKELDDALVNPVDLLENFSCVVMERIKGSDLFHKLKNNEDPKAIQLALEEGISIGARLHRFVPNGLENILYHDYSKDRFCPAGDEEKRALKSNAFTIVSRGFEIRNFMQSLETGRLKFFDPHDLYFGAPEEDFTRYVLSILMANWGRHLNFFVWKKFDLQRLINAYEETRGVSLNKDLLSYTFDLNIAMRKYFADKEIKKMPVFLQFLGVNYKRLYFLQISSWRDAHSI
jgi:hypothetical protein